MTTHHFPNTGDESDPYHRALWRLAQRHVADHHGPSGVRPEALAVVALRDLLVHAWESGGERTLAQSRAVDEALVRAAHASPPVALIVHQCTACGHLPDVVK